jgi:outer membrane protein TolC
MRDLLPSYAGLISLWLTAFACLAETPRLNTDSSTLASQEVEHIDPITVDSTLNLSQLLAYTLEKYPDRLINQALADQADAWQRRGNSWLAGSPALTMEYNDDRIANNSGAREAGANLEFTVWQWQQRDSAQAVASQSQQVADKQNAAVQLEVAGLVRQALWDMALAENVYQQAQYTLDISSRLLDKVKRRVELGDLARADLLLAESEHLQNRSALTQAEAEMMHSRKAYTSLTQTTRVPANYQETLSSRTRIDTDHPLLAAVNALIAREQAAVEWAKNTDTINQPKVAIGGRFSRDNYSGLEQQSAGIGVSIPFGHRTYDAPEIAAAHLERNRALAQREHLLRLLEKNLHEAEHGLEVSRKELAIAGQRQQLAETHLNMSEISFAAGEINLLDLLKIQSRSLEAIRYAREQQIRLQRNIAFYNQAVGVAP